VYGKNRRLEGEGYSLHAENFKTTAVNATLGSGQDTVIVYDLVNNDTLTGRGNRLTLNASDSVTTFGFEEAVAHARAGQKPKSDVSAVDYLFSRNGF
jgi:hypothetical protein